MLKKLITPIFLIGFFVTFAPTQVGGQVSYVTLDGNSMEPKMQTGDLAIVRKAAKYEIGDVVAYKNPKVGTVIHRIAERRGNKFVAKGDNNTWLDGYYFRPSEVVGKLWLHVPRAGGLAKGLQSPRNAAMLVGMLGTMSMATGTKEEKKRRGGRRRSKGESSPSSASPSPSRWLLAGPTAESALLAAIAASVAFALLAIFAFRHPAKILAPKPVPYTQEGTFNYTATVPQGIYDQPAVAPGEPVFQRLASLVNVTFDYELSTEAQASGGGSYRLVAELRQSDGWQRTFEITPTTAFEGGKFHTEGVLDLRNFQAVISALEAATGVPEDQTYTLDVAAYVTSKGLIAGKPIEEDFRPRLAFNIDPIKLTLNVESNAAPASAPSPGLGEETPAASSSPFVHSATGMIEQTLSKTNEVAILGFEMAVIAWRVLATTGLVLSVVSAIVLALMAYGSRSNPSGRIQAQYGPLLVNIEGGAGIGGKRKVRVAHMDDLAKVAEQEGRMILHIHGGGGQHRYFVVSDDVVYYYLLPAVAPQPVEELAATEALLVNDDPAGKPKMGHKVKIHGPQADIRVVEARNYDASIPPEATPEGSR